MAVSFGRLPEKKSLTGGIDIQISAEEDSSLIPRLALYWYDSGKSRCNEVIIMRGLAGLIVLFAALSFWPVNLMVQGQGQSGAGRYDIGNELETHQTYRLVAGKVQTPAGDPVVHARVEIANYAGAPYHDLTTDNQGEFRAEFNLLGQSDEIIHFTVTVKVTKKGFQPARRYAVMEESDHQIGFDITLRPVQPEDSTVLSQADLINGVASRLRQLGPSDGLSAKQQRDYAHGVQEFLDRGHAERALTLLRQGGQA